MEMKGKLIAASVFAVAVVVAVGIVGFLSGPAGAEILFETRKLDVPNEMWLLKKAGTITEDQAVFITSIFGVHGNLVRTESGWLMVENGPELGTFSEVHVFQYGGFRHLDDYQMRHRFIKPEDFLSDNECVEIANRFLENLRREGLIPQDQNLSIGFKDVIADIVTNGVTTYFTNKHVNYDLSYGDLPPFVGGMTKLRVYLNETGEITGFFGDFYRFEPFEKVKILQPEDAIQKAISPNITRVRVKSITLVYLVGLPEDPYIRPSYDVRMEYELEDGSEVSSAEVIPAFEQ